MAAKKKLTPAQKRDRRSKMMLGVLGVVLLLVLALQLPKLMKSGSGNATSAAPAATVTGAQSALIGRAAAPSQLASFSRFPAKDPFAALVKLPSGSVGSTTPAATNPAPKIKAPPKAPPVAFKIEPQKTQSPAPSGPMVPAAVLKIDGKRKVIPLGTMFPANAPVVRLVAVGAKEIWLELVGGSFANGETSLKVMKGHPVTLVNTTQGTRFTLALVKPTTAPKPAVTVTTTTAATTTAAVATTTSGG